MKLEKSTIEAMFLSERKLLKVPEYLAISMKEYAKVVYDIANVCMLKKNAPYIISCYSREVLPRMFEETCLVADIHYIEFLADFAHWKRLKEKSVIEAIFCKYQRNHYLHTNNIVNATFYEWLIRDKNYNLPHFSAEDYQEGFLINSVALMHEIMHFVKGFEENYGALFREHNIDKHVQNADESIVEGNCDYMAILILLEKGIGIEIPQEQIVDKYFQMMAANCLYKTIIESDTKDKGEKSAVKDLMDRVFATISFLYGMKNLTPNLDMDKINLDTLAISTEGLMSIAHFIDTQMRDLAKEFNNLPEDYKDSIYNNLNKQEKKLQTQKEFIVYPEIIIQA